MDFSFAVCDACDVTISLYWSPTDAEGSKPNAAVGSRTRASRGSSAAGQVLLSQLLQLLARRPKPGARGARGARSQRRCHGASGSLGPLGGKPVILQVPVPRWQGGCLFYSFFWPSRVFLLSLFFFFICFSPLSASKQFNCGSKAR